MQEAADKGAQKAADEVNPDTIPDKVNPLDVAAKVAAGLSKEQAVEVCVAQLEHDKAQAKTKSKK